MDHNDDVRPRPTASFRVLAPVALAVMLASCGSEDPASGTADSTSSTSSTAPTGSSTTTTPTTSAALPGERVETHPYQGARLAVVGVAAGDTLNVRSGPGTDYDAVFELSPLATATATGHNRSLDGGQWSEITADGRTGWAKTSFLLQPGDVRDITAMLFPTPGDRPKAETMRELGLAVAGRVAGDADPKPESVVVDEPPVGDVAEVTVDVIGFGDDSVGGQRLKIFADPPEDGEGFTLRSVEVTDLCRRAVDGNRLCV